MKEKVRSGIQRFDSVLRDQEEQHGQQRHRYGHRTGEKPQIRGGGRPAEESGHGGAQQGRGAEQIRLDREISQYLSGRTAAHMDKHGAQRRERRQHLCQR